MDTKGMSAHKRKIPTGVSPARKHRHHRRRTPPGSPPGTLVADPHSPHPTIRIFAYGPDDLVEQEVNDLQQVQDFLDKWPVLWVDVEGLGHVETIRELGEMFSLHRLALEDVLNVHQRPKVESYGDYHFIVTRMARLNEHVDTEQLTLFLGENFVLTFQEGQPGDCLDAIRQRIRQKRGRIRDAGLDYLAYALLDAVVDGYFPILEEYGERLETLEDEIVTHPSSNTVARIHEIRRDLLTLRRAMWPQREVFNALLREEMEMVTNETRLYLRDCYDHTTQIIDLVETYRELGADLTDVYLSSISNRTNEIMRVLTVIATIFIPLTFIAGVYGMNFNTSTSPWNMPELNWYWGYPFVFTLMTVIAVGQLAFFRRRGWLGSPKVMNRVRTANGDPPTS
jgi:magnesium transporter